MGGLPGAPGTRTSIRNAPAEESTAWRNSPLSTPAPVRRAAARAGRRRARARERPASRRPPGALALPSESANPRWCRRGNRASRRWRRRQSPCRRGPPDRIQERARVGGRVARPRPIELDANAEGREAREIAGNAGDIRTSPVFSAAADATVRVGAAERDHTTPRGQAIPAIERRRPIEQGRQRRAGPKEIRQPPRARASRESCRAIRCRRSATRAVDRRGGIGPSQRRFGGIRVRRDAEAAEPRARLRRPRRRCRRADTASAACRGRRSGPRRC